TYAAVVSLANVDKKSIQPILMIEAPRLIYPFARRVIADATRDGGFAPLNLNPIDFQQLFQENQARAAATSGAPGSTKLA
ncbi:MAG: protein-export chaperone SecB, partial [Alphaproteobacteria bacterium]